MHFTNPLLVLSGLITVSLSQNDYSPSSLEASLSSMQSSLQASLSAMHSSLEASQSSFLKTASTTSLHDYSTCESGVYIDGQCQGIGSQYVSCENNKCVTISTNCVNGVCSTSTAGSAAAPTMNPIQAAAGIAGFMGVALAF